MPSPSESSCPGLKTVGQLSSATWRSQSKSTATVADAWLSLGSESVVVLVTVSSPVTLFAVASSTRTATATVALAPAARSPSWQLTTAPRVQLPALAVAESTVEPADGKNCTTTFLAGSLPVLRTVPVNCACAHSATAVRATSRSVDRRRRRRRAVRLPWTVAR